MKGSRLLALLVVCLGGLLFGGGVEAATPGDGAGAEAVGRYRASAERGDAQAQFALGVCYYAG